VHAFSLEQNLRGFAVEHASESEFKMESLPVYSHELWEMPYGSAKDFWGI